MWTLLLPARRVDSGLRLLPIRPNYELGSGPSREGNLVATLQCHSVHLASNAPGLRGQGQLYSVPPRFPGALLPRFGGILILPIMCVWDLVSILCGWDPVQAAQRSLSSLCITLLPLSLIHI